MFAQRDSHHVHANHLLKKSLKDWSYGHLTQKCEPVLQPRLVYSVCYQLELVFLFTDTQIYCKINVKYRVLLETKLSNNTLS